jgi:lantibiotic modifying enzyme
MNGAPFPKAVEMALPRRPARYARALLEEAQSIGRCFSQAAQDDLETGGFVFPDGARIQSADLYNGLPGVALLLAWLSRLLDSGGMLELATRSMILPRKLLRQGDLPPGGAWQGRGGVLRALVHVWSITREDAFLLEALDAAEGLAASIPSDRVLDVVSGSAGLIRVLLDLHAIAPSPAILRASVLCGEHILRRRLQLSHGVGWLTIARAPLAGYAHGASGIASSLLHLAERTGEDRFAQAASMALQHERHLFELAESSAGSPDAILGADTISSWCYGAGGVAMSRWTIPKPYRDALPAQEIESFVQVLLTRRSPGHCLCHGALGDADLLLAAGRALQRPELSTAALTRVSAALSEKHGSGSWRIPSPLPRQQSYGLMSGLAGIAYGLIRAVSPHAVPSLLAWDAIHER